MLKKILLTKKFLLAILILAAFLSFYPHVSYPFPLHVDEWFHINVAKEIVKNNFAMPSADVFTGTASSTSQEPGWHYALAIFTFLFNPNIFVWQFLPPIVTLLGSKATKKAEIKAVLFPQRFAKK